MLDIIIETKTGEDKVALIKYAIENKYTLKFFYTGEKVKDPTNTQYTKKGYRWVQPVALGVSPKADENGNFNRVLLRGWQTGLGVTNTKKPEWKTFLVDEMSGVMVFDSSDSTWFAPFKQPDGYNLNTTGDQKFLNGRSFAHIDVSTEPGPDHKKRYRKMPPKTPKVTPQVEPEVEPEVEPTVAAAEPKKKVFRKKPTPPAIKAKPEEKPATTGPKEPIQKPKDQDSIASQIIPTKKGNSRKAEKPDTKNKKEPQKTPEEELNESFQSNKMWLNKLLEK